jgi:hypothetical protein
LIAAISRGKDEEAVKLSRLALNVFGAFLLVLGVIWILQGINILPGSFMTGDPMWAAAGAVVALGAVSILVVVNARRRR